MRHSVNRFTRLLISASLLVAFTPISTAGAVAQDTARTSSAAKQGIVSVVHQTTYFDERGARWVDAVVSNKSGFSLTGVRVPVTFGVDGQLVPDEVVTADVQPYVLAPGAAGSFHLELDGDTSNDWDPLVQSGIGVGAETQAHELTIVSVEAVEAENMVAPVRPVQSGPQALNVDPDAPEDAPADDEEPTVEDEPAAEDPDPGDEPDESTEPDEGIEEAAAAVRTYRVEVRNDTSMPLNHARVSGAEFVSDGTGGSVLIDTVLSDSWDMALEPGDSATLSVYGMASNDTDVPDISLDLAAFGLEVPVVTLKVLSAKPSYGSRVVLRAAVSRADGSPLSGTRELGIAWSVDGDEWETAEFDSQTGSVTKAIVLDGALRCKAVFGMDGEFAAAESGELVVKPASQVTEPKAAASVRKGRSFTVSGLVKPDYAAGTRKVKLQFYRFESGGWKLRKTALTTTYAYPGSYAKYSAKVKLSSTGKWKVRANNPGDDRAAGSVSGFDYLSVR